ncbi:hypothetical protein B484DRAFT_344267, partial [Ochromonadaceae sp. CCMP2298]
MMRNSNVNSILAGAQLYSLIQHWVYCDKGYSNNTHVRSAAHGPGYVSHLQWFHNAMMSRARVTIEWGFGKVYARCPFLKRPSLLKLQQTDVARLVRVAVFLTNAHTCMRQSGTGIYFDCAAPSLAEYFA